DDDGISTFANYPAARKLAGSRDGQYLLVGPWPHATNTRCVIPGVDFGPEETIDFEGYVLDWLDMALDVDPSRFGARGRARVFLMGANEWRDFADWPPPGVSEGSLFLASGGRANSLLGDGSLDPQPPKAGAESDAFVYDPDDPTPYLYDAGTLQVGGPFDARPVERRDDVLCYTTPPLREPLTLCGRVFAELFVASSAADTEFCAKLCDVHGNGVARQLCDGNVRLALRNSLAKKEPVAPGEVARVRIDLWATGIVIPAGHRLRLEVASAAVPKFAAHTNTLADPGSAAEAVVAHNRVFHDARRPSRVVLPILAEKA
ncbi:MAG: CocE/NonD family hydrolase, partial [Planctomycetes bacterium]|nr:CocE/NonD family hydrolase [Planctomycetota bacterium]